MSAPLISCIVPVYNGEAYIREALESIFAQAHRPLEVIVADDGSTDGTVEIVAAFGDRIRYLRQNNNRGPASVRNLGVGAAGGDFVAFLDADDLWHSEKLARQMARFDARPELACCVAHAENFWLPELHAEEAKFRNHRLTKSMPGYITGTLLARRSVFESVGGFNTSLQHGDAQDWFLRAAEAGMVMELLAEVLLYRRMHWTNWSRHVSSSLDDHLRIVKASLDRRRHKGSTVQPYQFYKAATERS